MWLFVKCGIWSKKNARAGTGEESSRWTTTRLLTLDHNPAPESWRMEFASEVEKAPQGLDFGDLPAPEGACQLQPGFQSQATGPVRNMTTNEGDLPNLGRVVVSLLGVVDLAALGITGNSRDSSNPVTIDSVNPPNSLSYWPARAQQYLPGGLPGAWIR
jgi:hypothetical protein